MSCLKQERPLSSLAAQSLISVESGCWTMDALHKLVSFGADPLAVLPNILILIVAAVVFGALAARRFKYA